MGFKLGKVLGNVVKPIVNVATLGQGDKILGSGGALEKVANVATLGLYNGVKNIGESDKAAAAEHNQQSADYFARGESLLGDMMKDSHAIDERNLGYATGQYNRQLGDVDQAIGAGKADYTRKLGLAGRLMSNADYTDADYATATDKAANDVNLAFNNEEDANRIRMGRYGLDPNSGGFGNRQFGLKKAGALAAAMTNMRRRMGETERANIADALKTDMSISDPTSTMYMARSGITDPRLNLNNLGLSAKQAGLNYYSGRGSDLTEQAVAEKQNAADKKSGLVGGLISGGTALLSKVI